MTDALQSLWRELLGSRWVLIVLPALVVVRWLLSSRLSFLAAVRDAFFGLALWNVLAWVPPPRPKSGGSDKDAALAAMSPVQYRRRWLLELVESALVALFLVFFLIRPFLVQAFYIPSPSMVETLEVNDRILVSKFTYRLRSPERGDIVVFRPPARASQASGSTDGSGDDWIKRVIGVPGDHIAVHDDHLYLNGKAQNEPYVALLDPHTDKDASSHVSTGHYDYVFPDPSMMDVPPGQNAYIYLAGPDSVNAQTYTTTLTSDTSPRPPGTGNQYVFFVHNDPVEGLQVVVPPGYVFVMGDNRNDSEDGHYWGYLSQKRILGQAVAIFWPPSRMRILSNPHH